MDEVHRKVLQRNRPYLMKEVMLETLWPHLVAREIFTDEMIEHIQATGAKPAQMQRLLSDLARRGPSAYQEFMDCLSDTEQQHIVDKLRTTEDTLRKREPKYLTPTMNSTSLNRTIRSEGSSSSHSNNGISAASTKLMPERVGHYTHPSLHPATQQELGHRMHPADTHPMSCPSQYLHPKMPIANQMPSHAVPTNQMPSHNVQTNQMPPHDVPTNHIVSQMAHTFGAHSNSANGSFHRSHVGENKPDVIPGTVTLMDCTSSGQTHSTHTLSFTAPSDYKHYHSETTPERRTDTADPSKEAVRRNLGSMFRSPMTETDNGEGVSIPSLKSEMRPGGIQATDHPHGLEINPYPEVLGIPQTSGRLKFTIDQSNSVSPNWNTMYKMTSEPRGYCLIINNRYFPGSHLKERLGTDVDKDNLFMLYSQLGYQICVQENLTGMEMLLTLRDFATLPQHTEVDSCVVVLLTHGLEGQIYGSDAKLINLTEVFGFFDGNVCPNLQGKPKFFLVQACRGEKFDAGFDLPDNGQADSGGPASQAIVDLQQQGINDMNNLSKKLPTGSDYLIAYATVPGFVSWRNSEQGSWFIQALCEVFSRQCKHEDALNMLVQVNNRVATIYESATKHKQMPSPVVLLRKKLYFFPVLSL